MGPEENNLYRSFSTLKRIKTYLRNSMTDSRLSSLGMLSIESERAKSLNMTAFVDVFAANPWRKDGVERSPV